jgi:exopolysaccharide production protein ExoQ
VPPSLALLVCLILVAALFRHDPAADSEVSPALWLPMTWLAIIGSRLPSQWLGGGGASSAAAAYEEGNSTDRLILTILIVLALAVLMSRAIAWQDAIARNSALTLWLLLTLVSTVWSDFPFVSLKRWIRDLGNYLMILVVLTDPRPYEAIHHVFRRLCYLLIPLSVVLIKYYPHIGRGYSEWTGTAFYLGVTTTKNMLGVLCLVSGLFFFWDTMKRWSARHERRGKAIIFVNVCFMLMTLWLLNLADSATAKVCLVVGCLVIAMGHGKWVDRNPARLKVLVPLSLCLYVIAHYVFQLSDMVSQAVGRDSTFTGRSDLWTDLLRVDINPILGTGYESFWLGERLQRIWERHPFRPNQAHNGYLEVYLNLGLLGLLLLAAVLAFSYRTICRRLDSRASLASLGLAMWTILLIYNNTEAAFKSQLLWLMFLLVGIAIPGNAEAAEIASPEGSVVVDVAGSPP